MKISSAVNILLLVFFKIVFSMEFGIRQDIVHSINEVGSIEEVQIIVSPALESETKFLIYKEVNFDNANMNEIFILVNSSKLQKLVQTLRNKIKEYNINKPDEKKLTKITLRMKKENVNYAVDRLKEIIPLSSSTHLRKIENFEIYLNTSIEVPTTVSWPRYTQKSFNILGVNKLLNQEKVMELIYRVKRSKLKGNIILCIGEQDVDNATNWFEIGIHSNRLLIGKTEFNVDENSKQKSKVDCLVYEIFVHPILEQSVAIEDEDWPGKVIKEIKDFIPRTVQNVFCIPYKLESKKITEFLILLKQIEVNAKFADSKPTLTFLISSDQKEKIETFMTALKSLNK